MYPNPLTEGEIVWQLEDWGGGGGSGIDQVKQMQTVVAPFPGLFSHLGWTDLVAATSCRDRSRPLGNPYHGSGGKVERNPGDVCPTSD